MKMKFLQSKRMVKTILIVLLFAMTGTMNGFGQEPLTLTLNEPDEYSYNQVTNSYVPFYGQFSDDYQYYSQFIIPASDLESVQYGEIQTLSFYISKDPWGYGYPSIEMPNWSYYDDQFQIYFAEVGNETFEYNANWEYELYEESEMTLVFDGADYYNHYGQYGDYYNVYEEGDYYKIQFYLHFEYNYDTRTESYYHYNGGNLLVYVKPTQMNNPYECWWLGVDQNQGGYYKEGDGPAAIYFDGDYVEGQYFKPMMTIEYVGGEAPSCPAPQDFEATPYAHYATLNWSTDASMVNIQYKKSSDWEWSVEVENYEWYGYSYDLVGLDSQTEYEVRVMAVCDEGDESEWSTISFMTTAPAAPTNLLAFNYDTPEATTAMLSWGVDYNDTPDYWDIAYTTDMTASPNNSDIITIDASENYSSYTLSDLTPFATYKVWIRSNFGVGDVSDWSEPCVFKTTNWENVIANQGYSENYVVPFNIRQKYSATSKSQFIITSDKLSNLVSHEIKKIKFAPHNMYGDENLPTATIQIYLKEVQDTEFSVAEYYNWNDMELVYQGGFSQYQMDLELTTPYYYAGGNLLVGICATTDYNNSNYYNRNDWYGITVNSNMALYSIGNGNASCLNFMPQTSFYYDPNEVLSCLNPSYLTVTATSSTTATLDWTPNGEEEAWDIYYTTDATFTPDEATTPNVVATNQKPYTIEGLTNETTYYAWVRANCGDSQSHWSSCCTLLTTDRIDLTVNDGTTTVYSPIFGYNNDFKKQLVIPASELETMINGDVQRLLFYSTTENKTWSNQFSFYMAEIGTSTLECEYDWAAMDLVYQGSLSVVDHLLAIVFDNPYKYEGGNLLIGITANGNVGTTTWYGTGDWESGQPKTTLSYLPGEAPSVARPQGLVASNVTVNSAEMNWNDMESVSWNLRYKIAEATEWTAVNPTNNSYQLTELTENTVYRVQVQAVNGEDLSSWSYLTEFRTLCEIIVVDAENPYTNDFSTDPIEECWTADESYYYGGSDVQIYSEEASTSLWMPSMHINVSDEELVCLSFNSSSDGVSLCSIFVNDTPIWESTDFEYNTVRNVILSLNEYRGQDVSVKFQVSNGYWTLWDVRLGIGLPMEFDNTFVIEGDWNEPSNWSTGEVPTIEQNIMLMAAATVSSGTVAYANSITSLYGEGSITIADGGQVYCNSNFEGTIEKDIIGYGDGEANWYLITIPHNKWENGGYKGIEPTDVEHLIDEVESNYDYYKFRPDYDGEEWRNYKCKEPDDTYMHHIQRTGILYANKSNVTLKYSGFLNTQNLNLYYDFYSEITPFGKWNLIGNPMLCNAYLSDGRDFYRMNEEGDAIVLADESNGGNAIKPCEGIFVLANYAGEAGAITSVPSTNNRQLDFSLAKNERSGLSIDKVRLRFNECLPLEKLTLMANPNKIYIPVDGKDYAVVNAGTIGEMPLNFEAAENGRYTIGVNTKDVEMRYLHLVDNLTGADVDLLKQPSYSFDAKTTDYASRFRVVFAQGNTTDQDDFAFMRDGHLLVFGDTVATLQIIDVAGRMISSEQFSGCYDKSINVTPGVYVLRLIQGENVRIQKVVVR